MGWLSNLFKKKAVSPTVNPKPQESPYLTQTVIFGMHQYRRPDEDSTVYFVDERRELRKKLVNSTGVIQKFPGFKDKEKLATLVDPKALTPQIRFRTSFEKRETGWIMYWEIQPDGRYWEDEDGFGGTNDQEVTLFTYVDENGDFTGPFELC